MSPAQLAILKTELNTDPHHLGYAALITIGNDDGLAALVNAIGAGGLFQVPNEPQPSEVIIGLIDPDDFKVMTLDQKQSLIVLLTPSLLDLANSNNVANLNACFPLAGKTLTNVANLAKRQGTRGEVLFGVNGIRVTSADVGAALNS